MKIVIAPDSFKGSNTSIEVADCIEQGALRVFPDAQIVKLPIADGGEGTVEALVAGAGGQIRTRVVTGPLGQPVAANYGILPGNIGVVELAAASGLPLVPIGQRDATRTTTYGTGELILACAQEGCQTIIVGLGGSATNDGGLGIAQSFGVRFLDPTGEELGHGGLALEQLATIDPAGLNPVLNDVHIIIACDVTNPLCGPTGASAVFGPQKGATPLQVEQLDHALCHYAAVVKEQLGRQIKEIPGSGAAGGAGVPLLLFCDSELRSGISTVLDVMHFEEHLVGCDLVVTGEGAIDSQSAYGKVPVGVGRRAKEAGVPVLAIVGGIGPGAEAVYESGIDSIMSSVNAPMELSEAIERSRELLAGAAERAMRMIRIGQQMSK